MIGLLSDYSSQNAARLVLSALHRSVTKTQASLMSLDTLHTSHPAILVCMNPPDHFDDKLISWLKSGKHKLILFGEIPESLALSMGGENTEMPKEFDQWCKSTPAPVHGYSESPATVCYTPLIRKLGGSEWRRPLERFDFANEWNNLGYGRIKCDGSIWSVSQSIVFPHTNLLASLNMEDRFQCSYAALFDSQDYSILWFNRAVGPIDSFEWRSVEGFISSYRSGDLPCQPVLREIPWGYDAAITMRLDCDEDVESARPLWQAYREKRIPFSLAVLTSNLSGSPQPLLRELAIAGESILSHSATHAPQWGGSYEAALLEAETSQHLLNSIPGVEVRYAVSPFHQTPSYALRALSDSGYKGCIGGIISSDPEFLLARGGFLTDLPEGFIGHSQQCMLHGDCMLSGEDPLLFFKDSFKLAMETFTLFGYLDHPFSSRYQYGWQDEKSRIKKHIEFIDFIKSYAKKPIFLGENDAMDFLLFKASTNVLEDGTRFKILLPSESSGRSALPLAVEFKEKCYKAVDGEIFS